MPKYSEIEWAFDFVSAAPYESNRAVYDKLTGQFLFASEEAEEDDIPEELDNERYIAVPHKYDLDLGTHLVFEFVHRICPNDAQIVQRIFCRPGAYGRFKEFLEERKLLEQWYAFETAAQRKAIEEWCAENGIEISEEDGAK